MTRRNLLFAALLSVFVSAPALADQHPADDQIVVTAPRIQDIAREFVGAISATLEGHQQLPRWDKHICVGVIGLTGSQGQFMADRISRRALDVGLLPGESGCKANVLIIATPDPDTLTAALMRDGRGLLGVERQFATINTRGRAALDAFAHSDDPVRWWHVAQMRTAEGYHVPEPPRGCAAYSTTDPTCPRRATQVHATSVSEPSREDFANVLVIVDETRVAGVQMAPLSDYIAMVALAQLNPGADTLGFNTILNLFSSPSGAALPTEMTEWDLAYLDGLYHARRNSMRTGAQEASIANHVIHDVTIARSQHNSPQ